MKTAILFDLDGTLLNTLQDLTDSVNFTLRHYGCPERSPMEIRSYLGNGARQLIALSLPGAASDPDTDEALAFYQDYYATHSQIKTRPYDGILEALAELKALYPIGVVSNKPDRATKPLCKKYFGEDIFALGEHAACPRKPAPDMLHHAMQALNVAKCIYVGDSEVDVQTARNAGVPCLGVLWGFRDEDVLVSSGADRLCRDPRELANCLKEMMEHG